MISKVLTNQLIYFLCFFSISSVGVSTPSPLFRVYCLHLTTWQQMTIYFPRKMFFFPECPTEWPRQRFLSFWNEKYQPAIYFTKNFSVPVMPNEKWNFFQCYISILNIPCRISDGICGMVVKELDNKRKIVYKYFILFYFFFYGSLSPKPILGFQIDMIS